MSLGILESNLQEIYSAVQDPKSTVPDLVPNLSGTRVYHTAAGWGRLWRWIFDVIDYCIGEEFKLVKLQQAIEKTQGIFQKKLPSIHAHVETYKKYLQRKSTGYPVVEEDFQKARKKITAWNHVTAPFLESLQKEGRDKVTSLFKKNLPPDLEKGKRKSLFFYDPEFASLQQMQKLIDFEGYLHEPLPLTILEKLATGKLLADSESKALDAWLEKLNGMRSKVDVGFFHSSMLAYVKYLSTLPSLQPPTIVNLEAALLDRNFTLFKTEDPVHVKWKDSLKPGDPIVCNGKKITLGEQIGAKAYGKDNNIIFSIKNDEEKVVSIAINQAVLGLREKISKEDGGGIHNAKYIEIDEEGRCALIERLQDSLENYKWKTTKAWLDHEDKDLLVPIAELLKWMVEKKTTPKNFAPKHLMFDGKGVLRSTKVCLLNEFDYTVLEDSVYNISNGNRTVFSYLMINSDLHGHSYQKFYKKIVALALKDDKDDHENIQRAIDLEIIDDPKIEDRGIALYKRVVQLKEYCCNKILEESKGAREKSIKKAVKNEISTLYNNIKSGGILWPTMKKEVVKEVLKQLQQ